MPEPALTVIAVGQTRKKTEGGSAGRLAAGRRPGRDAEPAPKARSGKSSGKSGGLKGKAKKAGAGSSNPIARGFKLIVLLALMAVVGFALVLVVDVGASIVGRAPFFKDARGDITFADLFDKVGTRVLDRDVPEPKKKPAPSTKTQPTTQKKTSTVEAPPPKTSSTPQVAPSPEDYAKHVEPREDPEVEQAKARLDALLKNL